MPQDTLVVVDVRLFFLMIDVCGEGASIQKSIDSPGNLDLTRVRPALVMNERIKGGLGSQKGLNAHGSKDLCKQREMDGIIES